MLEAIALVLAALGWAGHAYILTALLNYLYGCVLPKTFLKPLRLLIGLAILGFPLLVWAAGSVPLANVGPPDEPGASLWAVPLGLYLIVCLQFGLVFLCVTAERYLRKPPECVLAEQTRTLDLWPEYGAKLVGDGKGRPLTRIPGNCVFTLDITDLTLAVPGLPPEWDGLTLLLVSDVHFHGTPSRLYFERMIDELTAGPVPDLVCLGGDFVDTDTHREWIGPLLGRLQAKEAKLAILGNHDKYHDPQRLRADLAACGYAVLGNRWEEIVVRGVPCVAVGHEGPWFGPPPDLGGAPEGPFRLCLSHTPDNFYWGRANGVGLMLCGHVHGGGIRVPLVGSIFVPSVYGRRFDQGVFAECGTVMVVSRGVSGKEPIRIRCHPQVLRITLRAASHPPAAG